MPVSGPAMVRRHLGRWLRKLRKSAGKTEADVAAANIASRVKLWRIETGKSTVKSGVKPADVRGLCWLYATDPVTTDALTALAVASNQVGYWEDHQSLPTELRLFSGMEPIAEGIRIFEPGRVPDLLQTSDYMRGLRLAIDPTEIEHGLQERIKLHLERQRVVLTRAAPPRLTVILDAGALTRPVVSGDVMSGQVARLYELNRSDSVDIRVLPWEAGAHVATLAGEFTIFEFRDDEDPAVAYVPAPTGARYAEDASEVGEYRRIFRQLYEIAVPIETDRSRWG